MKFKKKMFFFCISLTFSLYFLYYCIIWKLPIQTPTSVNGWYHNISRMVSDYVSNNLPPHIMPTNFCRKNGAMLVMITTKPDNFGIRDVIRETWGQKRDHVSFYFLVGEDRNNNNELQVKLKIENEKYKDVIQERFTDTYNNLTLKSVNMLKLFTIYCSKSYHYLMKIDDDVFLNVHNVLYMLSNRRTVTDLLVGQLITEAKPERDPSSKWYVSYKYFSEDKYPNYLSGPTYIMSADVAEKLYHGTFETPMIFVEDVYITGICAKKVGVVPLHDENFKCLHAKKHICLYTKKYSVHGYRPEELRKSYKMLTENVCPAGGPLVEWLWSLFF